MAKIKSTVTKNAKTPEPSQSLADSLREIIGPAYQVKAMLKGALALIEDPGAYDDHDGEIWAARELIEVASLKVEEIYMDKCFAFGERLKALEGGAA